jgi:ParB family transcriptional regulator, chromosome partitioning protein
MTTTRRKTPDSTSEPPAGAATLEHLDPATLLMDRNIREARLTKDFVASISAHGVLVPLTAYRTPDGVRVRTGHRRALAAVQAGRPAVPVVVLGDEPDGTEAEIGRLLSQHDENTAREGLTAAEQAGFVQGLLDLGLTAAQVQRRARLSKAEVAAAQAVHASADAAGAAAANPGLILEKAAGIAEFDGSGETVTKLLQAAQAGEGTFRHTLQRARDDRAEQQAREAFAAELTAAG